jgi:hypothetical protein
MSNDFFKVSDGELDTTNGSFDVGGGSFEVIPDGTQVLAAIIEVKWDDLKVFGSEDTYKGISIKWQVDKPEELKKRVVFQKIKMGDPNPKVRDKAMRMLAAIDANCGGKLMAKGTKPTDSELASALSAKFMMLTLRVWGEKGEKQGNWVSAVAAKGAVPPSSPPPEIDVNQNIAF